MRVASLGYRDLAVELVGFPIHLYENLLSYDFTPKSTSFLWPASHFHIFFASFLVSS